MTDLEQAVMIIESLASQMKVLTAVKRPTTVVTSNGVQPAEPIYAAAHAGSNDLADAAMGWVLDFRKRTA